MNNYYQKKKNIFGEIIQNKIGDLKKNQMCGLIIRARN